MIVIFQSEVDGSPTIEKLRATLCDDELVVYMNDSSVLRIKSYKNRIIFNRDGNIKQKLIFEEGRITPSIYEGGGIKIPLKIKTIVLKQLETGVFVEYQLYQENNVISNHKISIIIDKSLEKMA